MTFDVRREIPHDTFRYFKGTRLFSPIGAKYRRPGHPPWLVNVSIFSDKLAITTVIKPYGTIQPHALSKVR
jgi:hypothetical protein